ncbi:succinate dehydrogenase subunit C [Georgenia satyanarayanai]|uniref:Succinate dehydrogenase subunit C n=1 Tax=Georgenia satyanarayanai TaxID=860221 RepID=A0A2Y9ABQ3_9MICO|nr:succinate dehydrogenase cytochrome b subunit [Georgenia satyanarayanai]PYG00590.1 succinate dehydrogenase subunit C [Georgenia satyanarayanai]SSA39979.1 succinate dehydrogenase subunit C [Georgenia satyanarayanai]
MSTTHTAARQVKGRRTSVALKLVMAVTGVIFLLFVLAHLYGNLKALSGQQAFDDYAHHLRVLGEPMLPESGFLWVMRLGLIVSLVLHVWSAIVLARRNRAARTQKYVMKKSVSSSLSSRTMMWGGLALLLFIVFHILQFTTLTIEVGGSFDSPYDRLVAAFETWWLVAIYVVAMIALGMHLRHGIFSAAQTLGWSNRTRQPMIKAVALAVAVLVVVGFLVPPLAIAFGLV